MRGQFQGRPQAVLFDMDGTLFDSEVLWDVAIKELAAAYGAEVPSETRLQMVGTSMYDSMDLLHQGINQPWRDGPAGAKWINDRVAELFATSLVWRPGAQELLHEVRAAGVPTALVTATQRSLVEVAVVTAGRENFDVLVCGDEVANTKPHPEPYAKAARLLGVEITHCVAIEDSPTGVTSALAAGATVLGIPHHVPIEPRPRLILRQTLAGVGLSDLVVLSGDSSA